jgi:hypothetical protein
MMRRSGRLWAVCVIVLSAPVEAGVLDADTCAKLYAERSELEARGVRGVLQLGPQQANLTPDRLAQVRQLITLDEQLQFRCAGARPLIELKEDAPEPPEAALAAAAVPKKVPKPRPATAAAPPGPPATPAAAKKAVAPAVVDPAAPNAAPAKKSPAARTKPKVDDAYRPPASGDPNSQGLGAQAPPAQKAN